MACFISFFKFHFTDLRPIIPDPQHWLQCLNGLLYIIFKFHFTDLRPIISDPQHWLQCLNGLLCIIFLYHFTDFRPILPAVRPERAPLFFLPPPPPPTTAAWGQQQHPPSPAQCCCNSNHPQSAPILAVTSNNPLTRLWIWWRKPKTIFVGRPLPGA